MLIRIVFEHPTRLPPKTKHAWSRLEVINATYAVLNLVP
jgi:hypothetical protein